MHREAHHTSVNRVQCGGLDAVRRGTERIDVLLHRRHLGQAVHAARDQRRTPCNERQAQARRASANMLHGTATEERHASGLEPGAALTDEGWVLHVECSSVSASSFGIPDMLTQPSDPTQPTAHHRDRTRRDATRQNHATVGSVTSISPFAGLIARCRRRPPFISTRTKGATHTSRSRGRNGRRFSKKKGWWNVIFLEGARYTQHIRATTTPVHRICTGRCGMVGVSPCPRRRGSGQGCPSTVQLHREGGRGRGSACVCSCR